MRVKKKKDPNKTSKLHFCNWNPPLASCEHDPTQSCPTCNPILWNPTSEESRLFSTEVIVEKLEKAKKAYYAGNPIMTDYEFDALEKTLFAINQDSDILEKVGSGA